MLMLTIAYRSNNKSALSADKSAVPTKVGPPKMDKDPSPPIAHA